MLHNKTSSKKNVCVDELIQKLNEGLPATPFSTLVDVGVTLTPVSGTHKSREESDPDLCVLRHFSSDSTQRSGKIPLVKSYSQSV